MSRSFHSRFADDIRGMVEHKKALGHKAESYEWNMQNFDRYCMKFFPEADILTDEIALRWCGAGKESGKSAYRASAIREFGRYLSAVGKKRMFYHGSSSRQKERGFPTFLRMRS